MKLFIDFLRSNKLVRVLMTLVILASFFGLAAHHHEAGETGHECAVCRLVQLIAAVVLTWGLFFIYKARPKICFVFLTDVPLFFPVRVSSLRNRAPPLTRD